jgi:hypothetical protein
MHPSAGPDTAPLNKMIQTDWTFRDEFIFWTQRWPQLVLAFLLGALIGWGVSALLPATYEARSEFYVAFNGDVYPRNPDDYKNSQIEELDAFLVSDPLLTAILADLQTSQPNLSNLTPRELANRLDLRWRNTGTWTLAVTGKDSQETQAIARAWQQSAQKQLTEASGHAQELLEIERELGRTGNELYLTRARLQVLDSTRQSLDRWQTALENQTSEASLTPIERWNLQLLAGQAVDNDPVSSNLLARIPAPQDPPAAYSAYVNQVRAALEEQVRLQTEREAALSQSQERLNADWQRTEQAARGITAYLTLEPLQSGEISVVRTSNAGLAALVGGLCGLLAFFFYRMVVWSRK